MNKVMEQIKKGKIKMKPKAYFVLGSVLLGAGTTGLMMLTVFLTGMVFFRLRMQAPTGGLRMFLGVFPFKFLALALTGLGGGSWLIRKQGKAYRLSILGLVIGVVATVVGLGFLIDRVGVNERLQRTRPLRPFYEMEERERLKWSPVPRRMPRPEMFRQMK